MKRLLTGKLTKILLCTFLASGVMALHADDDYFVKVQIRNVKSKDAIKVVPTEVADDFFDKSVSILGKNYKRNEYEVATANTTDDEKKNNELTITGKGALGEKWSYYEFSFTPDKSGYLTIKLSGTNSSNSYQDKAEDEKFLIAFDYFKVTGAYLYNTNFEFIDNNALRGWYNSGLLLKNKKQALNGSYFVGAANKFLLYRNFKVNEDKKVTIGFFAKKYEVNSDDIVSD
ncbi:hypothetical protein AAEX28_08190 [Lentisphaerota bacterium WC36G]|nr:hypothetical protein LJT99_11045 [Lentisphaerae bacterium WC36]